jgi:hypothetical protein
MRTTRTRSLIAALLALLMVLAACGSDTDVAEPEAGDEEELALDLEEEPAEAETPLRRTPPRKSRPPSSTSSPPSTTTSAPCRRAGAPWATSRR